MFMFACNTIDTWTDVIANLTLSQFYKHRVKPGQLSFAPWPAYKIMTDLPRGNWQYADNLPWTDGACASTNHPYIKLLQDYGPVYPIIELHLSDEKCENNQTAFCAAKYWGFLVNATLRARTINAAVLACTLNGYSGYNIDVEIGIEWLQNTQFSDLMRRQWGYLWASFLSEFSYALKAVNPNWILQADICGCGSGNYDYMQMTPDMYIASVDEIISMCTYTSYHPNSTGFNPNDLNRLSCIKETYGAKVGRVGLDQGNLGKKGLRELTNELTAVGKKNLSKVALFSAPGPIYFDPAALNILHHWLVTNYTVPPLEGHRGVGRVVHTANTAWDGGNSKNSPPATLL